MQPSLKDSGARALQGLACLITVAFFLFGLLYSIAGIDRTLDIWPAILSQTYPVDNLPIVEWDRVMFKAHKVPLYVHTVLCPLALFLGLFQLSRRFHQRYPRIHRISGVLYLLCLAIGIPAGIWLSRFEYAGPVATLGYAAMGTGTLLCTGMAVMALVRKDYSEHRGWMLRSYCMLWSSSIGFRLILIFVVPFLSQQLGPLPESFREPYIAFIFISPVLGLFAADIFLYFRRQQVLSSASLTSPAP
jgi:hypothetical protein